MSAEHWFLLGLKWRCQGLIDLCLWESPSLAEQTRLKMNIWPRSCSLHACCVELVVYAHCCVELVVYACPMYYDTSEVSIANERFLRNQPQCNKLYSPNSVPSCLWDISTVGLFFFFTLNIFSCLWRVQSSLENFSGMASPSLDSPVFLKCFDLL